VQALRRQVAIILRTSVDIPPWVQTCSLRLKVEEKDFDLEHAKKLVAPTWSGHLKITVVGKGTDGGCHAELRGPTWQLRDMFANWSGHYERKDGTVLMAREMGAVYCRQSPQMTEQVMVSVLSQLTTKVYVRSMEFKGSLRTETIQALR